MTRVVVTRPHTHAMYARLGVVEAVRCANTVYVSGQVGWDQNLVPLAGFPAQVRQAAQYLCTVLQDAGAAPRHIAQLMVFIVPPAPGEGSFSDRMTEAFTFLRESLPELRVAATAVATPALAAPGLLIEVQAVAVVDD
jgi:enamine deaminase RidA (YjgF/YER057c/UK114 family)